LLRQFTIQLSSRSGQQLAFNDCKMSVDVHEAFDFLNHWGLIDQTDE
jgi:hypothetical protein